jgi:hypothetical protein
VWLKIESARQILPVVGAAAVFTGLSVFAAAHPATEWVLRRVVPAGSPITPGDVQPESAPPSVAPRPGDVAAVTLVPGQTLVPADLRHRADTPRAVSVALSFDAGALVGVQAGDQVQLVAQSRDGVWLSPPVWVTAVADGATGTAGTVRVAGPWTTVRAILTHTADHWAIVDRTPP